jgi:hypothetical protein
MREALVTVTEGSGSYHLYDIVLAVPAHSFVSSLQKNDMRYCGKYNDMVSFPFARLCHSISLFAKGDVLAVSFSFHCCLSYVIAISFFASPIFHCLPRAMF